MQPGEIYQLAVVVTMLFVAPFNALARVIIGAWLVARGLWVAGLSEPKADILAEIAIIMVGWRYCYKAPELWAWRLSLLLALANAAWCAGLMAPPLAWWAVLILACLQLSFLPFALDRESAAKELRRLHSALDRIFYLRPAQALEFAT